MVERPTNTNARTLHWDSVYRRQSRDQVSWYEREPMVSLELVDTVGVESHARVIDVGGGSSSLVDALLTRGCSDVTVLDVSAAALSASRERNGDARGVAWIVHDLLTWEPPHTYDLWHDRALFHFLSADEATRYRELLLRSVAPGGHVIIATFAPDGPTHCSGLAVTRYDADHLREFLGDEFRVLFARHEVHTTPNGALQPFTWIVAQRTSGESR